MAGLYFTCMSVSLYQYAKALFFYLRNFSLKLMSSQSVSEPTVK